MAVTLGARSLANMEHLHPDLIRVIKRAAAMAAPEQDFTILEGARSEEQMLINYGKGRTVAECAAKNVPAKYAQPTLTKVTWLGDPLMSNHRIHADGFGHAFDGAPFPVDWKDTKRFLAYGNLMKAAAQAEGVKIVWGGNWAKPDMPHVELA